MSLTKLGAYVVRGRHQSSVTFARATRLPVAPIASTAVSRPTSEPEDFLRPKTLAAKTVAPLGAHLTPCYCRLLESMQPSYLFSDLARPAPELLCRVNHSVKANKSALTTNPRCAAINQPKLFRAASVEAAPSPDISMNARNT